MKALITGISGQDGAFLSKRLIQLGIKVFGTTRNLDNGNFKRLELLGITEQINLVELDPTNKNDVFEICSEINPDWIINLSGQSSVGQSHVDVYETINSNILPVINFLEYIRFSKKDIRFYQASSSEIFGNPSSLPITLNHEKSPNSPYGLSKSIALDYLEFYRDNYNIFACSGILFNHESFLRDDRFFLKKLISESVKVKNGLQDKIELGNLDISRDFGYADDYMEAVIKIISHTVPKNYLVCSGNSTKLKDIVSYVLEKLNLDSEVVSIKKELIRGTEIDLNYGDPNPIKSELNWISSVNIFDVVDEMIVYEQRKQTK